MIAIHPDHTSVVDPVDRILEEPVSASRLNLFHSCRLKFYFRYVLKLKKPASPALHVGKTIHAMLQEWSKRRWMGKPADSKNLREHLDYHWQLSLENEPVVFEEGEEEAEKSKAWLLVEMYLRDTPIPMDEKPMGVEISVERDLSEHGLPSLRGVIDLVRADGRIVDFKTSATTPNLEQVLHRNEVQLTAYGLLYREATGERETGFELHHLVKTKVPKLVVTKHRSALSAASRWISRAGGIHWVEESGAGAAVKTGASCQGGAESKSLCHQFLDGVELSPRCVSRVVTVEMSRLGKR